MKTFLTCLLALTLIGATGCVSTPPGMVPAKPAAPATPAEKDDEEEELAAKLAPQVLQLRVLQLQALQPQGLLLHCQPPAQGPGRLPAASPESSALIG